MGSPRQADQLGRSFGIYKHFSPVIMPWGFCCLHTTMQTPARPLAHSSASPPPTRRATCPLQPGGDFILGLTTQAHLMDFPRLMSAY